MDRYPEFFQARFCFRRAKHDIFHQQAFFQRGLRFGATVAGELVCLGGDDDKATACVLEEFDELDVGLLWRNVAVDKTQAERERGAVGEVGLDKFRPLGGDGFGDFCVAVSGQIGEVHLGLLALGCVGDGEEIDGSSTSGGGGDFGLFGVEERVQQAGFTDVRAAQECNLRDRRRRKLCGRVSGDEEF